jgi:hypothetical protein
MDELKNQISALLKKLNDNSQDTLQPNASMTDLTDLRDNLDLYFETEDKTISERRNKEDKTVSDSREIVNENLISILRLAGGNIEKNLIVEKLKNFYVGLTEYESAQQTHSGGKPHRMKLAKSRRKRRKSFRRTK